MLTLECNWQCVGATVRGWTLGLQQLDMISRWKCGYFKSCVWHSIVICRLFLHTGPSSGKLA